MERKSPASGACHHSRPALPGKFIPESVPAYVWRRGGGTFVPEILFASCHARSEGAAVWGRFYGIRSVRWRVCREFLWGCVRVCGFRRCTCGIVPGFFRHERFAATPCKSERKRVQNVKFRGWWKCINNHILYCRNSE